MESERAAEWISASRLAPFLKAANEDLDAALDLYHWHARVGAACFLTMHHLEVLVRNAIDGELGKEHPDEPLTQTWLMDFDVLRPDAVKQVIVAVERLEKGKAITRGRVIAAPSAPEMRRGSTTARSTTSTSPMRTAPCETSSTPAPSAASPGRVATASADDHQRTCPRAAGKRRLMGPGAYSLSARCAAAVASRG